MMILHLFLFFARLVLLFMGGALLFPVTSWVVQGFKKDKRVLAISLPLAAVCIILVIDGTCRVLHLPRHVLPQQIQIALLIDRMMPCAAVFLIGGKVWEWWKKRKDSSGKSDARDPQI